MHPKEGSQWIARWAKDRADAYIWTVRGVTVHGIYITCPTSRYLGHLLSPDEFSRDYIAA